MDWDETLERVRSAADFCASSGLARFRIEETDFEIEVRRAPRPGTPGDGEASAGAVAAEPPIATNGAAREQQRRTLKAEFVGIVRFARPSVVLGTLVAADRELAYVESLGIRNPVRSGGAGRIAEIFVNDGEPVEFGQPLLAIEPQRV